MRKFSKPKLSVVEKARKNHLKREQYVFVKSSLVHGAPAKTAI